MSVFLNTSSGNIVNKNTLIQNQNNYILIIRMIL
ncbi:hypothetical protein HNP38_000105 [Chryseobacterium defluvii]|uniref:Uncharacterized protein n=1 Tax=Chryseobacterium defluvii TaxID=160396 RepID=A0A840KBB8_9FLAO|nr:hypothetical protein [Chryseobacterium defluvii]